jgi:hypothetical protein
MATAAAKRAIERIEYGSMKEADTWAEKTEEWLIKAGADGASYTYRQPFIKP